tara:strand:- start:788 stop:1345 length:558 start_codon:yes stop_codon:yes gene_type:complete
MSNAADNLGQNVGKLYRESTSIGADVGGLYSEAISIDNNPIQPGGGGSDNTFVAGLQTLPRNGQSSQFPFQLVAESPNLYVRQGTIGSIIPTIGGTALEADYTENDLSTPNTGTRQYWLNVTVASGAVTAVSIVTAEPGADSATQAKLLLGSVETNSNSIVAFNSNLSGSQSFASCGSTHFFGVV